MLGGFAGKSLDHWHLVSLDAPTVAVVWTVSFAAAVHMRLPVPGSAMLALATWLLYVADRLLDAARPTHPASLQFRHRFHQRHRRIFLTLGACAIPVLGWLVITRLDPAQRHEDLVLTACALLYLLCVHFPFRWAAGRRIRLQKELVVGIIFAAACVIPTWSREPAVRPWLVMPALLFAILCWMNCVAIDYWEGSCEPGSRSTPAQMHKATLRIGQHFSGVALFIATIAAVAGTLLPVHPPAPDAAALLGLYFSVAMSILALAWLHKRRRVIRAVRLRAAADAVLLTPAILLPIVEFAYRLWLHPMPA